MTDRIPVIGITAYREPASFSDEVDVDAVALPATYVDAVSAAGGVPAVLPPVATAEAATALIRALDGLIVAGGEDVNPARYGAAPDPHVTEWSDVRDAGELLLLDAAEAAALPVLGICRGMQVMAVHAGGTLIQHLPDVVGHTRHSPGDDYADNAIEVLPGCRLAALVPRTFVGSSFHHQAVAEHPGFVAAARDADGVLQAMEAPGERFAVAVQWHPEQRPDVGVFAGLVEAARAARS